MRILLVEDIPKARQLIRQILLNNIPRIEKIWECEDGPESIRLYQAHQPDWVLMDISLKNSGNGIHATTEITRQFPQAKIIIVSGYDESEYRSAAKAAGAVCYIQKDNLSELISVLKTVDKQCLQNKQPKNDPENF